MSDISDLESRISAAMDRIGRGLETLAAPVVADSDAKVEALQADLDSEKSANAQLEERNKTLHGKVEEMETALSTANDAVEKAVQAREAVESDLATVRAEAEAAKDAAQEAAVQAEDKEPTLDLDENREAVARLSKRLRRLRHTSRQLRGAIVALREAAEKDVSDHSLINQALVAELENLKAMRATELAEMDLIIAAMRPMLETGVDDADSAKEQGAKENGAKEQGDS